MTLRTVRPLTWLMIASVGILAAGIVVIASGLVLHDPLWQLIGLMGVVAGAVKVGVVLIWTRVAGLGADDYTPTPAP
ncbi:MAG: hypothetical protein QM753_06190 [Thermomicrobiales bacterium]